MTIRRSVNIATINKDFMLFEAGVEAAPAGTFQQARDIRDMVLGYSCDEFLRVAKNQSLETCNCDGIREIECLMFDMLRTKNPDSQIEQAIGLGRALEHAEEPGAAVTKEDIIARLASDRSFVQSQRDADVDALLQELTGLTSMDPAFDRLVGRAVASGHISAGEGAKIAETAGIAKPGSYRAACDALKEGKGELWMVRVVNSFDVNDYVELEVRAEIMEDAAVKAEAHATAHADMYFDIDQRPTFGAIRREIYRIDEQGDQIMPPIEKAIHIENKGAGTAEWAILAPDGNIVERGFEHQYQAETKIADRVHAWEEAHGLRTPDDSEERFAGSDAPFPGQEA